MDLTPRNAGKDSRQRHEEANLWVGITVGFMIGIFFTLGVLYLQAY